MKLEDKGPIQPPLTLTKFPQQVSTEIQSWPGIIAATHWEIYDKTKPDGADFSCPSFLSYKFLRFISEAISSAEGIQFTFDNKIILFSVWLGTIKKVELSSLSTIDALMKTHCSQ